MASAMRVVMVAVLLCPIESRKERSKREEEVFVAMFSLQGRAVAADTPLPLSDLSGSESAHKGDATSLWSAERFNSEAVLTEPTSDIARHFAAELTELARDLYSAHFERCAHVEHERAEPCTICTWRHATNHPMIAAVKWMDQ